MELTYKIIGGDGNEYGPVALDQLKAWIHEGRLDGESQVRRSDQKVWVAAVSLPELGLAPQPSGTGPAAVVAAPRPRPTPAARPASLDQMKLSGTARSGASWFYWIAGLSLVNSMSALMGSHFGFIVGLGITQKFDAIASGLGGSGKIVAFLLDLAAAGVFVLFGVFANKLHTWAFLVGMILYALDGLIFLLVGDWLSAGFHVFALFCIFGGFSANRRLHALQGG
jgi:hypothetical protein